MCFANRAGKIPYRILEPSRGAIGKILNMARARLIFRLKTIMIIIISGTEFGSGMIPIAVTNLIIRPLIRARIIFDRGPAALIHSMPCFGFFKL
jgi:hypothetical protein